MRHRLPIPPTYKQYEDLPAGHSRAANSARDDEICEGSRSTGQKLLARAFAIVLKGVLCCSKLDAALKYARAMRAQGCFVPPFAMTLLFKVAAEAERLVDIFQVCLTDACGRRWP